jgi:hypothetical protein
LRALPLSLLIAALPSQALADRGPALLVGLVGTYTEGLGSEQVLRGLGGHLELGGSLPVGYEEDELFLMGRVGLGTVGTSLLMHGGFRSVFGRDEWQTYMDLGAAVHLRPSFWVGPRVGLGVRRALSETFTLYSGLGGQLGFGSGLRLDIELCAGLRWGL